jgi:hypothetical protein
MAPGLKEEEMARAAIDGLSLPQANAALAAGLPVSGPEIVDRQARLVPQWPTVAPLVRGLSGLSGLAASRSDLPCAVQA